MNIIKNLIRTSNGHPSSIKEVDYNSLIERGFLLVDVRTPVEYKSTNIVGSINVPLGELKSKLTQFSESNRPVVFYCKSGRRAAQAVEMVKKHRLECYNGGALSKLNDTLKRHQYGISQVIPEATNFAPVIPVKSSSRGHQF